MARGEHPATTRTEHSRRILKDMTDIELRQIAKHMDNWGYDLLDPPHAGSPGGRLLLVAMRRLPTNEHYDPEALRLLLADERGAQGYVTLGRSAQFARPSKVCPGQFSITDRVHKRVDYYCFGGQLTVVQIADADPPYKLFILESSAPILTLNSALGHLVEDQLVDSVEALYARLRATHARLRLNMPPVLAQIPPLSLYAACIESMWTMYSESPTLPTVFGEFYRLLANERLWLNSLNGARPPQIPLEQIIAQKIAALPK